MSDKRFWWNVIVQEVLGEGGANRGRPWQRACSIFPGTIVGKYADSGSEEGWGLSGMLASSFEESSGEVGSSF